MRFTDLFLDGDMKIEFLGTSKNSLQNIRVLQYLTSIDQALIAHRGVPLRCGGGMWDSINVGVGLRGTSVARVALD